MTRGRMGGWQKPVAPPTGSRPRGLPPKPPVRIERADIRIDGEQYGGHWMFTIGNERCGIRVTRGNLDRQARWRRNRPDIFPLWKGRRRMFIEALRVGRHYVGTCTATQHRAVLTSGKGTYCAWHRWRKRRG